MIQSKNQKANRTVAWIILLFVYISIQFIWWAYMLYDLNVEIAELKLQLSNTDALPQADLITQQIQYNLFKKSVMILGEGSVFFVLLIIGFIVVYKSFIKEVALANRQKNFLLSITHELNSPLASIKLFLQSLQHRKIDEEKQASLVKSAITETNRLQTLVENMLLAARIENHSYKALKEAFKINEWAEQECTLLQQLYGNTHTIEYSILSQDTLHSDVNALTSILHNLVSNAVKYSPANSSIHIEIESKGKNLLLSVSDEGIGIPTNERAKVFERFYRVENEETRNTKGSGLGLYICKQLAQLINATLSVKNNTTRGTTFELEIPFT
jgi:signal transduction histidine kinase